MLKSNFLYLADEYPILFNLGQAAEFQLHSDPITCLFKLRQFGERLTEILFEEHRIDFPFENSFHNRIKTLEFEGILPATVNDLLHTIKNKGNISVHQNKGTLDDAKGTLFSSFKVAKWFYQSYSKENKDLSQLRFFVPENLDARHSINELEKQYKDLQEKFDLLISNREKTELPKAKIEEIKQRSQKAASKIEMTEAETRELIDAQLRQAGWEADTNLLNYKLHKTIPQRGRKIAIAEWPVGTKWADYALFIGTELYGIAEAKKYSTDISTDLRQSKIYSSLAETQNEATLLGKWSDYKVPFLFSTNGRPYLEQIKTKSGVWFLDVREKHNTSRPLQGKYSSDDAEIAKYSPKKEDVLFNRTYSPELVGKTSIYLGEQPALYAGYLIKFETETDIILKYLNYVLNTNYTRKWCWEVKTDGVSQSNINALKLGAFVLLLPPRAEQKEIVKRVEELFLFADKIESQYQILKEKIENLPQAILNKAFKGELVEQVERDEPASALLARIERSRNERIRKEKNKEGKNSATKKYLDNEGELGMVAEIKGIYKVKNKTRNPFA